MNTKTMEGLAGARTNMNLLNTPMRVYKEARRKGDIATMERAMGYVNDFADKTEEYKTKADKGMEEEAKETREKLKLRREEVLQKRREEREKLEEKMEENRSADTNTDTVEISEEGKILLEDSIDLNKEGINKIETGTVKDPVTYTNTGKVVHVERRQEF